MIAHPCSILSTLSWLTKKQGVCPSISSVFLHDLFQLLVTFLWIREKNRMNLDIWWAPCKRCECQSTALAAALSAVSASLLQLDLDADSPLTADQHRGHRAQLNLQTKSRSVLMTQWDLPVRAGSVPAAVTADARLTGTTVSTHSTNRFQPARSPSWGYSPLKPLCLPPGLMLLEQQERGREVVSEPGTQHTGLLCPLLWRVGELQPVWVWIQASASTCGDVLLLSCIKVAPWIWSFSCSLLKISRACIWPLTSDQHKSDKQEDTMSDVDG